MPSLFRLPRIGIGGRLLAAFGMMSVLTVAASGIALLGAERLGAALGMAVEESLPATRRALGLSAESAGLAAFAPNLAAAQTAEAAEAARAALHQRHQDLLHHVGEATLRLAPEAAEALDSAAAGMQASLAALDTATTTRLALETETASTVAAMRAAHQQVLETLGPLIDDANFNLTIGLQSAADAGSPEAIAAQLGALADTELAGLVALLDSRANANLLAGLLLEASQTPDPHALVPLADRATASAAHIARGLEMLGDTPEIATLRTAATALVGHADGAVSIFSLRRRMMAALGDADAALAQARDASVALDGQVGALIAAADATAHQASQAARQSLESGRIQLLAISGAAILMAICIAWFYVGRSLLPRLTALRLAMQDVAAGTLDRATPMRGRDELTEMAASLAALRDRLLAARNAERQQADERAHMQADRAAMLEGLAAAFERGVGGVAQDVSLAADATRQAVQAIATTTAATSHEARAITEAAETARGDTTSVAAAAEELAATVAEVSRQVGQSSSIASQAVAEAEHSNAIMQGLAEAAERIGDVVKLISGIAGQTNLLALNATIEAARAGEAGKGFAVVAGEVKALAAETAKATEEIGRQIEGVRGASGRAVQAIRGIAGVVRQIDRIAGDIAVAVDAQGEATRQIAQSIASAAAGTASVSDSIGRVTAGVAAAEAAIGTLRGTADGVAAQGETLREELGRFLVRLRAA